MEKTGFELSFEDHDDYRLIRTVLPRHVSTQSLSVVIDRYLALWDTHLPIYIVNDASRLTELDDEVSAVLLAILKRNLLDPRFRASSWFTGGNARLDAQLRELHSKAGRDPESILQTEADALAYIERQRASGDR